MNKTFFVVPGISIVFVISQQEDKSWRILMVGRNGECYMGPHARLTLTEVLNWFNERSYRGFWF